MANFVKDWRKARGLRQADLADAIGRTEAQVSRIESGKSTLTERAAEAIAAALDCTVAELYARPPAADKTLVQVGEQRAPGAIAGRARPLSDVARWPHDLPVYGVAAGAPGPDGAFQIEPTQVVDYVRRPPPVAGIVDAYALYVVENSMTPAFPPGELIVVHPGRPARQGDPVVVQVSRGRDGALEAFLKIFKARDDQKLTVSQFNPPQDLTFKIDQIVAVHRVLRLSEILGA